MQLAASLKTTATVYHKDVIDAMFRQPFSSATIPFAANTINSNAVINAADYDLGKNGYAYWDNDTADYHVSGVSGRGNKGGVYRNDGVDISKDAAGYYVSSMEKGEWLQYSLDVKKAGLYSLQLTVAAKENGNISFSVDENTIPAVDIPAGDITDWKKIAAGSYKFSKGRHTLRVYANAGTLNLRAIQLIIQ
ncbi:MAG: carbohydrate-binding domain-containing protein [Bacteroidota bacterium]